MKKLNFLPGKPGYGVKGKWKVKIEGVKKTVIEEFTTDEGKCIQDVIDHYNATLRSHEKPRKLLEAIEEEYVKVHRWGGKENTVGLNDKGGIYDLYKCLDCGKKYKRYAVGWNPPREGCKETKEQKLRNQIRSMMDGDEDLETWGGAHQDVYEVGLEEMNEAQLKQMDREMKQYIKERAAEVKVKKKPKAKSKPTPKPKTNAKPEDYEIQIGRLTIQLPSLMNADKIREGLKLGQSIKLQVKGQKPQGYDFEVIDGKRDIYHDYRGLWCTRVEGEEHKARRMYARSDDGGKTRWGKGTDYVFCPVCERVIYYPK